MLGLVDWRTHWMRALLALSILVFVSVNATAQRSPNSPFEIARAINSQRNFVQAAVYLKTLWDDLKIPAGTFTTDACGYRCSADVTQHNLDDQSGKEVVVKLIGGEACRYMVFKHTQAKWRFVGFVDHDFNRYEMSTHRVLFLNGHNFLAVRGQAGSGTGFSLYGETLYRVRNERVAPVLPYWSSGHTFPWPSGLGREFKTIITNRSNQIEVVYIVKYTMLDYVNDKLIVWLTNTHRVRYRWDNQQNQFVFDSKESDLSEDEVAAIANAKTDDSTPSVGNTTFPDKKQFIGGGYQVFLKSNLNRLMRIARGPNLLQKRWLREVLREVEHTAEKKELEAALARSRF